MSDYTYAEKALLRSKIASEADDWGGVLSYADEALQHDPTCAEAYFMLGRAAMHSKLYGLATQLFHSGTKLAPEIAAMWNNLGVSLQERDDAGAYQAFRKAYELNPQSATTLSSLCAVSYTLGRYDEALSWAALCLKVDPDHRDVIYNQSLSLLALGRWEEAWPKYNITLGIKDRAVRNYHGERETPRWAGEKDAKVVIYGEQGIGDEVMFASMIPDAIATGAAVILETERRLEGLYRRSFPQAKVYPTRGQKVVEWVPKEKPTHRLEVGGLGDLYGAQPRWTKGYLVADPAKRAMARAYLDHEAKPGNMRIGIAWTGGAWATGRRERTVPIKEMSPLFSIPGIEWFCMEYDDPREELKQIKGWFDVDVHDPRSMVSRSADYDDTAALVSELDLVIAPTTSIVDLCGALGRPVWAFVPANPQWRYGPAAGKERMFFYESATVFRQKEQGRWGWPVIEAGKRLRAMAKAAPKSMEPASVPELLAGCA